MMTSSPSPPPPPPSLPSPSLDPLVTLIPRHSHHPYHLLIPITPVIIPKGERRQKKSANTNFLMKRSEIVRKVSNHFFDTKTPLPFARRVKINGPLLSFWKWSEMAKSLCVCVGGGQIFFNLKFVLLEMAKKLVKSLV